MMRYLGKSINMVLVLLIVGIVVVTVSITMFYQFILSTRTKDFETTSGNLSSCENQLNVCRQAAQEAQKQLNSTTQDIRRYDQLYETKVAELQDISEELKDVQSQILNLRLIKTSLEAQVSGLQGDVRERDQQINILKGRISSLEDDVDYYKDKYTCCKSNPEQCNEC